MSHFHIFVSLFGDPVWKQKGRPATKLTGKDAALIARLALDGPQSRAALCELLWPDSGGEQAEASLRQRASRLNRAAAHRFIDLGAQVRLGAEVAVDVLLLSTFDDEALLHTGALLAGHDLGDNDQLDRWLQQARARTCAAVVQLLADRAETLEAAGRLRESIPMAARAVELAPLNEHAWRRLIRLHYLRNDLAAAREAGLRVAAVLRDELGARPSTETLELMRTVEAAEQAAAPPRRPVPASLLRPPVLIGRLQVWQAMSSAWQRRQAFLIIGDAGQGKSRLLEEFLKQQGGVLRDKAQHGDESSPYAVLGRLLVAVQRRYALQLPTAVAAELARIRPEFGEPPTWPANSPVLWHAMEHLLVLAMAQGLEGIVIDDLHNVDVATLEALCWLNARPDLQPLRIGLASRPMRTGPGLDAVVAWLGASHRPVELQLEPLTPAELCALLSSLALPSLLDAQIADRLYRHAGGHLLLTLATLQDAIASGAGLASDALPRSSSIQALLDERMQGLPPQALALVRVAAVAGQDFNAERAARLLEQPLLDLVGAWAVLEAADILRGEVFSHDLMHESAMRSVPTGVQLALHRRLAEVLVDDAAAVPSRVAWHWEQGGRWAEAARSWQAAAKQARLAGRLDEQIDFYGRAATLYQRAGDDAGRFESLMERLHGLRLRSGGAAVLASLPELEALAGTGVQRLRCHLTRAMAWLDGGQGEQAAEAAATALREAAFHPEWRAQAGVTHAQALSQCGAFEEALAAAHGALAAAHPAPPSVRLDAFNALSYAHYATGQLAAALRWQQQAVAEAERQADHATAVLGEGNVAALLASIGDVPATYAQALRTRERYADIRVGTNSIFGVVNHIVLGNAAAALGYFDQALQALQAAVSCAGAEAAPLSRVKANLALAQLWLTLGRAEDSIALVDALPDQVIPGMAMQAALLRARAAEQLDLPTARHLDRLAGLAARHRDLPLVQSAWFEVSYVGDAQEVLATLSGIRAQCERLGLTGTARSLHWRELVRWLDLTATEATHRAREAADALAPHATSGLSAKCYPPEVWWTMALAYQRAGQPARRADALKAAQRWIEAAMPHVPPSLRSGFQQRNRINRLVLASATPH